jgi:hypothetical protein
MAAFNDNINLFDRINLANCAMRRAQANVIDEQRFYGEYGTARMWNKYKCVITTNYSYVDDN